MGGVDLRRRRFWPCHATIPGSRKRSGILALLHLPLVRPFRLLITQLDQTDFPLQAFRVGHDGSAHGGQMAQLLIGGFEFAAEPAKMIQGPQAAQQPQ